MERRKFLSSLAAIPFLNKLAPKPEVVNDAKGLFAEPWGDVSWGGSNYLTYGDFPWKEMSATINISAEDIVHGNGGIVERIEKRQKTELEAMRRLLAEDMYGKPRRWFRV